MVVGSLDSKETHVVTTAQAAPGAQEVRAPAGALAGSLDNGVPVFKGIPYAAAPVGEREPHAVERLVVAEHGPTLPAAAKKRTRRP